MTLRRTDFDRLLIDWADEFIQDLVASFSATRPTIMLRVAVAALYLLAALHLAWAVLLPLFRGAIAGLLGAGASGLSPSQLTAFATGIVIGGVSYHLLLTVAYLLMSFVVRARRRWTRLVSTIVLLVSIGVAFNGLRSPTVAGIILAMQWTSLVLAATITVLLWAGALAESVAPARAPKQRLSNERA